MIEATYHTKLNNNKIKNKILKMDSETYFSSDSEYSELANEIPFVGGHLEAVSVRTRFHSCTHET